MVKDILLTFAPTIAKNTQQIIGHDVLLTDNKGIIIAAQNPKRLGTLHLHSLTIIEKGIAEGVHKERATELGVLEGICLPIRYGNEIIGTVAVGGNPDEVSMYGHLVQKETELFIREKALQEISHLKENAVLNLINQIITFDPKDISEDVLISHANGLGYDLSAGQIPFLINITQFAGVVKKIQNEEYVTHEAELRIQTIKTTIVEFLRDIFNNHQDIIGNITSDKYLVLMSGSTIPAFSDKDSFIKKKAEQIIDVIASKGYSAQVGIGYYADTPDKFKGSFRSAWNALNIGKKIPNSSNIYNIKDFTLENLLLSLNKENVTVFVTPYLKNVRSSKDWNDELETTLREWLNHPYQPSEVAHKLGIHRNSLYYRIDKITEISGFDIKNPQDIFFLKFCILLEDLFKSK